LPADNEPLLPGQLGEPSSGAGRFMVLPASYGLPIRPIGVYEEEGNFLFALETITCWMSNQDYHQKNKMAQPPKS
jgi:hypothetical protein